MTRPIGNPASSKKSVPDAPSISSATNNGTNRAFNNGRVDIVLSAPSFDGKLPITEYTVTPNPATTPATFTGSGTSITVTGLNVQSSPYTFTARATNPIGISPVSNSSGNVTITTCPSDPIMNFGNFSATIPFGNAPQFVAGWINSVVSGGTPITAYEYTSNGGTNWRSFGVAASPGSTTVQSNGSNFVAGTDYLFFIRAVNANGPSGISSTGVSYRAATVPQAPISVTATRISNTVARLTWTAGATGGSPLTSILINCTPNANVPGLSYTTTDVDGTIDVTGPYVLSQGYTFTINVSSLFGTSLGTTSNSVVLNTSTPPVVPPVVPPVTPPPVTPPPVTPPPVTPPPVTPPPVTPPPVTPPPVTPPPVTPPPVTPPPVTPPPVTPPPVTPPPVTPPPVTPPGFCDCFCPTCTGCPLPPCCGGQGFC